MQLAVHRSAVFVRAPAKINLFLEVLGKRPDGYHEIATLMLAVRLFDTLVFQDEPGGSIVLQCQRPELSTGPDNLIHKAARLLRDQTGCTRGARIRLVKRIPMAAGLAGGSSDAAATLIGLNRLWQLGLPEVNLEALSAGLGSDIPFFFHLPAAWCTGRGEKVSPASVGRTLHLVIVAPASGLSTAAVYQRVRVADVPAQGSDLRRALAEGDVTSLGRLLFNRLQEPAQGLSPAVGRWYERLAGLKPAGQLMSGSGSSLFALCHTRAEAESLAQLLREEATQEQCNVYVVRSCVS